MTEGADPSGQPLMGHLTELRSRLVKTFIAVGVGTVVAFFFRNQMLHLLQNSYSEVAGRDLVVTGPTDQFSIAMRMALFGGTVLASPVIAYQAWSFINPGLTQKERKWAFPVVAALVKQHLGFKYHWAVADYLQRSARHIASKTDVDQAYALGKAAVEFALAGKNAIMPVIVRTSDNPYRWEIGQADLEDVANVEKFMPGEFISADGFGITPACRAYLEPLIQGEDYPPYRNGMPDYVRLRNAPVAKKTAAGFELRR